MKKFFENETVLDVISFIIVVAFCGLITVLIQPNTIY